MKVEKNNVVAVSYELMVEGQLADKAGSESPLEYIHGTGMLLPKFEAALEGKEPGDSFAFTLTPSEGYGEYDENYKVDVPIGAFEYQGEIRRDILVVGNILPMYSADGQIVQGRIEKVGEDTVTMDFNHPMAGKTLNFSGKVESVRAATEKELTEGLHGEYLPKGCEGCGGNCEGGCEGSCEGGCHGEGEGHCHGEGHCKHHEE